MWNFKEGLSPEEKIEAGKKLKTMLEDLVNTIPELDKMVFFTDVVKASDREAILDSSFKDEEALKAYMVHPEHQKVVEYAKTVLQDRLVMDFFE